MAVCLKDLYEETVASQLKVWDDEIEHLDARADILLAQVEDRYYCLIRHLRVKERELRTKLNELRVAKGDDWEGYKAELARITSELRDEIALAVHEIDLAHC